MPAVLGACDGGDFFSEWHQGCGLNLFLCVLNRYVEMWPGWVEKRGHSERLWLLSLWFSQRAE